MSCSVDPSSWGAKNQVALGTGKVNEWVLARTTRDQPTLSSIPETARAVMVKWFPHSTPLDTQFADAGDAVDDVQVHAVSQAMPVPSSDDQRREALDPLPLLAASDSAPLFVTLSFNYRGYAKTMPWPVWTADNWSVLRDSKLCPFDCDWMLMWAKSPAKLKDAPTEKSFLEKVSEHAPAPFAAGADLVRLAGYGIALYAAVQTFHLARALRVPDRIRRRA